ncbi:MAG: class I SAM-dependent methyltransferase [candidate division WOR-3 bacterium]
MPSDEEYNPEFHKILSGVESWHFWFRTRRARLLKELKRRLRHSDRFLEVGCGTGNLTSYLAIKGFLALGCDLFPCAFWKGNPRPLIIGADAVSLPFADDSFDGVGFFDILEHLDNPDRALSEARRVLRPGGFVFITVPASRALWSAVDSVAGHRKRYSAKEARELLEDNNFLVRKVSHMFLGLFLPIYLASKRPSYNTLDAQVSVGKFANSIASLFFYLEDVILDFINWPFGTTVLAVGQKPGGAIRETAGTGKD